MLSVKLDVSALRECTKIVMIEVPLASRVEQLADVVKDLKISDEDIASSSLHFWTRTGKRLQNKLQLRRTRLTDQPFLVAEVCTRPQSQPQSQHSLSSGARDAIPDVGEGSQDLSCRNTVLRDNGDRNPDQQVPPATRTKQSNIDVMKGRKLEAEQVLHNRMSELEVSCPDGDDDSDDDIQIVHVSGEYTVTDQQIKSFMTAIFQRHHEKKFQKSPDFELVITRLEEAYPNKLSGREETVKNLYRELFTSCPKRNDDVTAIESVVGRYRLTKEDFATLQDGCWLNDNIINAYLYLLSVADPTTYPFSTFFYPTLMEKGYKSVQRWTKKENLFKYRLLLVPVHLGYHWTVATINVKGHIIEYYDSMGSANPACLRNLKMFMTLEATRHKNPKWMLKTWKTSSIEGAVPRQSIGGDCGVFACQFAKCMVAREPAAFHQDQMSRLRRQMAKDILRGEVNI